MNQYRADLHHHTTHSDGKFAGWFTAATGGTAVTEETSVPKADTTLYAHRNFKNFNVSSSGGHSGTKISENETAAYNPYDNEDY